jgi:hypothetical protein
MQERSFWVVGSFDFYDLDKPSDAMTFLIEPARIPRMA